MKLKISVVLILSICSALAAAQSSANIARLLTEEDGKVFSIYNHDGKSIYALHNGEKIPLRVPEKIHLEIEKPLNELSLAFFPIDMPIFVQERPLESASYHVLGSWSILPVNKQEEPNDTLDDFLSDIRKEHPGNILRFSARYQIHHNNPQQMAFGRMRPFSFPDIGELKPDADILLPALNQRPAYFFLRNGEFLFPSDLFNLSPIQYQQFFAALLADDPGLLLKVEPQISFRDQLLYGNAPAHYAAWMDAKNCLEWFRAQGDAMLVKNNKDQLPIHVAALVGASKALEFLVKEYGDRRYRRDDLGMSPIHWAGYLGHFDSLKILNRCEADLKLKDKYSRSLMSYAINQNHGPMAEFLTLHKVKLGGRNLATELLYVRAATSDHRVVAALLNEGADPNRASDHTSVTCQAARNPDPKVLQLLHQKGAKWDTPLKESGYYPLHFAAISGNIDATRYLLSLGTNVNCQGHDGVTPLFVATLFGKPKIVRLLLEFNADPDCQGSGGYSALKTAALVGNRESFLDLLAAGATCNLDISEALEMVLSAFQYDVPEIITLALDQCLTPDFQFHNRLPARWVANFFDAHRCEEALRLAGAPLPDINYFNLANPGDLDAKIEPLKIIPPPFSKEDEEKYGTPTIHFRMLIDEVGEVLLIRVQNSPSRELSHRLIPFIRKWKFAPPQVNGTPCLTQFVLPVRLKAKEPTQKIWNVDQLGKRPEILKSFSPTYPDSLQKKGISGQVIMEMVIDEHGNIQSAKPFGLYHPDLVQAVLKVLPKWKFSPAEINGNPVNALVRLPVNFALR